MTAAPLHAIGRRRSTSLALTALLTALLTLAACTDSADTTPAGRASAARGAVGTEMEDAGDVIIEASSDAYAGGVVATPGSVTGTVSLASPLTPAAPVATGKDSALCGASVADSSVQQRGTGLGNAVVWLEGIRKGKAVPLEKRLELESIHCVLVPRVQVAFTGGAVNVLGHDPFRQHLRFIAGGEKQPRAAVLLGKDEQVIPTELPLKTPGLVIVRDADHPWPRAFVAVFDHPYVAITKPDGTFTIDGVPAGSYTLVAWHERTGRTEQKVDVAAGGVVKVEVGVAGK